MDRGFSYNFKVWLEGIEVNAQSFTIKSTPNGNEISLSMFATNEIWDLKPKTSIVIGYKDPITDDWNICFEGFFSRFGDSEQATQARSIALIGRDFRMDIRKAPAALAWDPIRDPLKIKTYYNRMGIFNTYCVKGIHPKGRQGEEIATYNRSAEALLDLAGTIRRIAGTAYGAGLRKRGDEYIYTSKFGEALTFRGQKPSAGTMLDTIVRGLWLQSVSGTSMMAFLDKRLRMEKKILTPVNEAGYNFWKKQNAGATMASHLMGNSRFSSLEAAIMRMASIFSVKPTSCSTPSIIRVDSESKSSKWVMDPLVRDFLVDRESAEFGPPYILNTSMLLPNLEFTAPPNFNIVTPVWYDNKYMEYDIDLDITRAHFTQTHVLNDKGGNELGALSIQFPNSLFNNDRIGVAADAYKRRQPPMTMEERYKGVNVFYGEIAQRIVMDDARSAIYEDYTSSEARRAIEDEIEEINSEIEAINKNDSVNNDILKGSGLTKDQQDGLLTQLKNRRFEKISRKKYINKTNKGKSSEASARHSLIKYMNRKFIGRVSTCDMAFNPFLVCGFPGLIVGDYNNPGKSAEKSVIGLIQQVKHQVYINPDGSDCTTSIVMSNSRLINEPTSVNDVGNPLYMRPTRGKDAEIDLDTLEYKNAGYTIPPAKAPDRVVPKGNNTPYDIVAEDTVENYPYAKDLLSLTIEEIKKGARNKVYLDKEYEPNRIAKFYTEVFQQNSNHFMIGSFQDGDETKYYMYDSIHEAVENLATRKETLDSYTRSYNLIKRNVCSVDEYFINILGCSVIKRDDEGNTSYVLDDPDTKIAREKYFGVTSEWYDNNKDRYTKMDGPGDFSSLSERMPVTAFTKERVEAVKNYKRSLNFVASSER